VEIDASIDALADALSAAGVDPPRPPSEATDLDAVDAAIAPLALPQQLRRFWERVDLRSLHLWPYPHPIEAAFALDTWKEHRDEFPGMAPRPLFLVAYESWTCLSVELDSPFGPGGALFEWRLEDGGFHQRYHELSEWLDRMTELVLAGEFERRDGVHGPTLVLLDPHTPMTMSARPAIAYYERELLKWPLHWQRLSGIEREDVKLRGATHTIAELLASDRSQPLEATIVARVTDLGSWSGNTRVRVDDGTGVMAINCPTAVTALGPGMRREFEFDVIVPAGERHVPRDPGALEKLADPVRDLSQRLMARYGDPATAVATAVRPR
jgi:hypothetical protein